MKQQQQNNPWQHSPLAKQLGITLPLIQAPMAGGATTAKLVAAVSNAGGLGSLGAGYMHADAIKKTIRNIRELTDKPFAVNLFIPEKHHATHEQLKNMTAVVNRVCSPLNITVEAPEPPYTPDFTEQIEVIISENIPVFSFTFGILEQQYRKKLKKNNTLLIGTATSLAEAKALQSAGIDIIAAQSSEAGGHRGTFIGDPLEFISESRALMPELIQHIKLPIIAAGGIMNSADILDMLHLGVAGVQMGTAFLTTKESGINPTYKNCLLEAIEDNTVLTKVFSGKLARGIENKFITMMEPIKDDCLEYPVQNALTHTMRSAAREQYNPDYMSLWAGQSAHLCQELPAEELVRQLDEEVTARNQDI